MPNAKRFLVLFALAIPAVAQTPVNSAGTPVVGAPAGGSATVTAASVAAAVSAQSGCSGTNVWVPATNTCVPQSAAAATATSPGTVSLPVGGVTTQLSPAALTSSADNAQTNPGSADGFAKLLAGPCATGSGHLASACDLMVSPAYTRSDLSRYFTPATQQTISELNAKFPTAGGIGRPRFSEDRRTANRYYTSINSWGLTDNYINDRTPFIWESRTSNTTSYADNNGVGTFRLRSFGGHNWNVAGTNNQKMNYLALALDAQVRTSGQGGGQLASYLLHTSPGDDMAFTLQHDTNGCSENEDECNKLFRSFIETKVSRWGGTLNATPTADSAGFGNYAMQVTVGSGYSPYDSGIDTFLVDLSNSYTSGNVTGILASGYTGVAKITGDVATGWAARYGASVSTTLTAVIDSSQYNDSCPSTKTGGYQVPNPFETDENGIGGLTSYCATVVSTSGFTDGQRVSVVGPQSNFETTKIVHVVDSTHMTMNATNPHAVGEMIWGGGAQGLGISMVADDIAPGGLVNYAVQPATTLHKFFPVVGSDSLGNLYAYTNEAAVGPELQTKATARNSPAIQPVISSISTSGTTVTAVNLSEVGRFRVDGTNLYNYGGNGIQMVVAAPTISWTGCTVPPTTILTLVPGLVHAFDYGLQITVTNGGNCPSPAATLSPSQPNPYRITPLAVIKKVINPVTGSPNDGYVMTGAIDPNQWHSGDTLENPGWIHDRTGSMVFLGKYFGGSSRGFGIADITHFVGDWGGGDTLRGITNDTDGSHYYPSAAKPIGPGVAYETPPNGHGFYGDYNTLFPVGTPPMTSIFNVGCSPWSGAAVWYHPCKDGIPTAYNLFAMNSTSSENFHLRYDPTQGGLLSWDGPLAASSFGGCTIVGGVATCPGGFNSSGTTPGASILPAGVGNIAALPANAGGFAAPNSGGTSYLFKLPATVAAGLFFAAPPATADGVNESALSLLAPGAAGAVLTSNGPGVAPSFQASVPSGELVVPYSATPTFNGAYKFNRVTLAGSMSPAIASGVTGQGKVCFVFAHDATANSYTITWPTNILAANQPSPIANSHFKQCFDWQPADAAFVADSIGLIY